jgi:hypothetical protein
MANLAQTLRQVGYVTPQGQVTGPNAPLAQQLKNYVTNVIPTAAQNLAQQRADIDAGLTMGDQGIQVGDREAFERQMAQVPNLMGLTAYHGTPHTIKGKFDISKVGTGEGAQAYGHGMYFAENPVVAKQYATDRSYVGKVMAGTPDNTPWDAQRIAQDTLNVHGDNAIAQLQSTLKANSQLKNPKQVEANKQLEDAIDILKTNQLQPTGNLYKVDIPDADIPNMLSWDKPLREQPEILKTLGFDVKKYDKLKAQRDAMPKKFDIDIPEELAQYNKAMVLEKQMREMPIDVSGKYFYESLIKKYGTQKAISEALAEKGIKGIRYLDAGSRGKAAERSSNFVVFEPSQVKILEQNSKPMTRKEILEQELKKVVE